ncbi:MAG: nuclear transport factor 2 family protein [Solirubrobacterales bacterium]|nr:nuclear transport factor 2 family protein [Solirubrobacterales bacterium]
MSEHDQLARARDSYEAFAAGDRDAIEALFAGDFTFSSPADPLLDRAGYFERCWPNHHNIAGFAIVRLIEDGDEVVVTYEARRADGTSFRNTEVLTFDGDGRIRRAEVYFGWDLPDDAAEA